jgi:hypothetical protein
VLFVQWQNHSSKGQQVISMGTSLTGNCLRPLGPSEQYFWLSNQNSAKHFVIAAEVVGDATVEAWVSAVAAAQLRHPLLRVSVEYGPDGPPCFREHANILIPLRIVPEEEFAAWQVEMAKELAAPIPFSGAPLARVTLLRQNGGSTLLVAMHHSIADGLSSAFVIRDILEALSGEASSAIDLDSSPGKSLLGSSGVGFPGTDPNRLTCIPISNEQRASFTDPMVNSRVVRQPFPSRILSCLPVIRPESTCRDETTPRVGHPDVCVGARGVGAKGDTSLTSSDEIEFPSLLRCGFCKNLLRVAWLPF